MNKSVFVIQVKAGNTWIDVIFNEGSEFEDLVQAKKLYAKIRDLFKSNKYRLVMRTTVETVIYD